MCDNCKPITKEQITEAWKRGAIWDVSEEEVPQVRTGPVVKRPEITTGEDDIWRDYTSWEGCIDDVCEHCESFFLSCCDEE